MVSTNKGHVLVADDDPHARELMAFSLERAGCKVTAARDGRSLWQRLSMPRSEDAQPVQLVITDVQMPGFTGLEVLRRLQTQDAPPVVLVSGHCSALLRQRARRLGAVALLSKPLSMEHIRAIALGLLPAQSEPPAEHVGQLA